MSEIREIYAHLAELRGRVVRIAVVIMVFLTFVLAFKIEQSVIGGVVVYYPTPEPLNNIASQITNYMKDTLVPDGVQLIQTAPGQAFYAQVYISALVAIVISMPIIVRELTAFIKPALSEVEINAVRSIALPAVALFTVGAVFAYVTVIPFMLDFLYQFGESSGLVTFLNIMDFVAFVLQFLIAFGVAFQLPLIMYAVTVTGITDSKFWRRNIRYAIVVLVVLGAIVTPDGSGVTMWFVSGPMIGLYFVGMAILERRENKIKNAQNGA